MNMAVIKNHDFVEIEYTGIIKENNAVFDTTSKSIAKENGLNDENADYFPMIICIGENQALKGLEEQIVGKETGKEYRFEISFEKAFGRRYPNLIQLITANKFRQQKIQPIPGLRINVDGLFGVIKTVSGGRCLVDFNHPLAGRDLIYNVKINKIVDDVKEKVDSLIKSSFHIKDAQIEIKEDSATISLKGKVPNKAQEEFKKLVNRTIPEIKNLSIIAEEDK